MSRVKVLGLPARPSSAAVVEDNVPGIEAARAAGMRALAFARHSDAGELRATGDL